MQIICADFLNGVNWLIPLHCIGFNEKNSAFPTQHPFSQPVSQQISVLSPAQNCVSTDYGLILNTVNKSILEQTPHNAS